jgi:hypothetical protein
VYVAEYEDVKKSDRVNSAGRVCYVERNYWMIDESAFVIIKINDNCSTMKFSGTLIAYNYVKTKNLNKIVVYS